MSTVTDLLERITGSGLRRLCGIHGLPKRGPVDELRRALAPVYRRDAEGLLADLRQSDLVKLFRLPVEGEEGSWRLPSRWRRPREELTEIARAVFLRREIHDAMEPRSDGDSFEDDRDEGDETSVGLESDEGQDLDADTDDVEAPDDAPRAPARLFERLSTKTVEVDHKVLRGLTREWSRPRSIERIHRHLWPDEEPPLRLRASRFQRMIEALSGLGAEVADEGETPFAPDALSPGIDGRVRLRLKHAAPSASVATPRAPARGATTASATPARVVVVEGAPRAQPALSHSVGGAYELALLRLEFLTAVPSIDRQHHRSWPDEFLGAAARGAEIGEVHQRLLKLAASGYCRGTHDPIGVVHRLTQSLAADAWAELIDDFARLNAHSPDVVAMVTGYIASLGGPIPPPRAPAPRVPPPASAPRAELPRAAAPALPTHAPKTAAANGRDMGALDGMFDD